MSKTLTKLNQKLTNAIKKLENSTTPATKIIVALAVVAGTALTAATLFGEKSDITTSTVMITTMNEASGGSGVIIESSNGKTKILTNRHVCEVASNGGLVKTTTGQKHTILKLQQSEAHDLCLITVAAKLKGKVALAGQSPDMYEPATVSGHPALLPNVVTKGHFSGIQVINVFTGVRKCTKQEWDDEDLGLLCFFFNGVLPVVQTFESVLVTATIMPGSSGSAVYNSSKELSGVIFAGSGNIGYGFAVPYEYVANFLNDEVQTLEPIYPNYKLDIRQILKEEFNQTKVFQDLRKKCDSVNQENLEQDTRKKIIDICEVVIKDLDWREKVNE